MLKRHHWKLQRRGRMEMEWITTVNGNHSVICVCWSAVTESLLLMVLLTMGAAGMSYG